MHVCVRVRVRVCVHVRVRVCVCACPHVSLLACYVMCVLGVLAYTQTQLKYQIFPTPISSGCIETLPHPHTH